MKGGKFGRCDALSFCGSVPSSLARNVADKFPQCRSKGEHSLKMNAQKIGLPTERLLLVDRRRVEKRGLIERVQA